MPSYSGYTPEIVNLDKGLDFVTPRPSTAPGALIDCFNYEVADALGYKRIDGIERFDGRPSISNCYGLYYAASYVATSPPKTPTLGDCLYITDSTNGTQDAFAVVTSATTDVGSGGTVYFYVFNIEKFLGSIVNTVTVTDTQGREFTLSSPLYTWHYNSNTLNSEAISGMVTAYGLAETTVTPVATQAQGDGDHYNPAIGLQWWNDQLYAVVDFDSVILIDVTEQIYPGDILSNTGNSGNILVRDVQVVSGAYSTADAVLKVSFSWLDHSDTNVGSYNVSTHRYTFTPTASVSIIRGGTTVSNVGTIGTTTTILSNRMAGLFRSWGINNLPKGSSYGDQGWQEIDLGYICNYTYIGQNSGAEFTIAGRDSQPAASAITNITAGQASLTGTPSPSAGGATSSDNAWHTGSGTVTSLLASVDGLTLQTWLPQGLTPHSGTSNTIAISGWDFSALPSDALISGLEIVVVANFNTAASAAKVQVTPTSDLLSGAVSKSTSKLGNITTATSSFNIAAVSSTQSITVNNAANLSIGNQIYVADSITAPTKAIYGTITAIASSTLTVRTDTIAAGTAGDTINTSSPVRIINVLGGQADLWGTSNITVAALQDPTFALNVLCSGATNLTSGFVGIDQIYIKIYYQETSSVYYFWNGTDDVTGVVTTFTIDSGNFSTDTASGIIQVSNVAAYSTAARQNIQDGDQIRTAPGGAGNCYGTISGDVSYAGLPSHNKLQTNASQYEFLVANFFGNKDWAAIYGVSGAGRAFVYDGFYFRYIFTGLNDTLDLPRHLAFHNFHLCLGYQTGAVLASVAGDPESFDGVLGATEFDTGDAITGLLRMNGTTLGLFCKNSIQALNGTDINSFSLSILNPYEGAIEYTVVDCGKPVYASYKGISTFDQTNAYGSFLGNRLSADITPWLLPRLTNQPVGLETQLLAFTSPSTQGVWFALPVRNKNQYKLFFKDGYCLTLTFKGTDQTPEFTLQQFTYGINLGTGSPGAFTLIPFAHSSAVDSNGRDRNHLSFYDPITQSNNDAADYRYIYELDRGWGIGSNPIQAYFTTTHNFFANPLEISNIRILRLHGQSKGASTLTVTASSNYEYADFQYGEGYTIPGIGPPPVPTSRSNATPQDISLPRAGFDNSPYTLSSDFKPATNKADLAKSGRSFSLQFVTDPTTIEPPHAAQAFMIQITDNKADV